MKKVAKLVIIDNDNKYLLMYRSGHPTFGDDPDLPGGTLEGREQPVDTMVREVFEEAGVVILKDQVSLVYEGSDYSAHQTQYSLYLTHVDERPEVVMSWEHSSYEWLELESFLEKMKAAKDLYMQMVYDVLK